MKIDLNADVGESFEENHVGNDEELIPLVSSVNIACGFHGGDPLTMKKTIDLAIRSGARIGAHPSFYDLKNFGRVTQTISPEKLEAQILYQLSAITGMLKTQGQTLNHVKLHGALYHHVSEIPASASSVLNAIHAIVPDAWIVGAAQSTFTKEAKNRGFKVAHEAFVDRRYQEDGTLVPRSQKGALLDSTDESLRQAIEIVRDHQVTLDHGRKISITANTLCIHGDHAHSVQNARLIRKGLENAGFQIAPFA